MKPQSLLVGLLAATPALARSTLAARTTSALSNKPSTAPHINQITDQGCFNSSKGLKLEDENLDFNTDGACGLLCQKKGKNVGATTGGQECWCGDTYPPKGALVDDSECSFPCTGFGETACGGFETWSVYNTGVKLAVANYEDETTSSSSSSSTSSSSSSSSSSDGTTSSSSGTETSSTQTEDDATDNTKTIGIVVGVVVSLVVVGSAIGGVFWYLRKKRNQEIEEEHRRNAAVNAFINGSNPPGSSQGSVSMTDSRIDPIMANRRLSNGSIDDNQDYSRKILRVTNA